MEEFESWEQQVWTRVYPEGEEAPIDPPLEEVEPDEEAYPVEVNEYGISAADQAAVEEELRLIFMASPRDEL